MSIITPIVGAISPLNHSLFISTPVNGMEIFMFLELLVAGLNILKIQRLERNSELLLNLMNPLSVGFCFVKWRREKKCPA